MQTEFGCTRARVSGRYVDAAYRPLTAEHGLVNVVLVDTGKRAAVTLMEASGGIKDFPRERR